MSKKDELVKRLQNLTLEIGKEALETKDEEMTLLVTSLTCILGSFRAGRSEEVARLLSCHVVEKLLSSS